MIQVGEQTSDFEMEAIMGREFMKVGLSDCEGKWVVLFFYPLDHIFVRRTKIKEFAKRHEEIEVLNGQVFGASVDSKYAHLTFILDPEGIVRWVVISDANVGRSVDETIRVLKALQTGELCPVEWEPGEETLGKAA